MSRTSRKQNRIQPARLRFSYAVPKCDGHLRHLCQNLTFMAKSSTRRVTIYINGKEVEASVKQIRAEMNRLVNEQNRMVIGSDEYISHAKKIKELRSTSRNTRRKSAPPPPRGRRCTTRCCSSERARRFDADSLLPRQRDQHPQAGGHRPRRHGRCLFQHHQDHRTDPRADGGAQRELQEPGHPHQPRTAQQPHLHRGQARLSDDATLTTGKTVENHCGIDLQRVPLYPIPKILENKM